jgi:hypothetical protein
MEVWKDVVGYEGFYEVSSAGAIRSTSRTVQNSTSPGDFRRHEARVLKPWLTVHGYPCVSLSMYGVVKRFTVHKLVAAAFIGPRPPRMEVCHLDGNRANPAAANLRYDTRSNNHADKVGHGTHRRGERHPLARLTARDVEEIRKDTRPQHIIGAQYGVRQGQISRIKSGTRWRMAP